MDHRTVSGSLTLQSDRFFTGLTSYVDVWSKLTNVRRCVPSLLLRVADSLRVTVGSMNTFHASHDWHFRTP